MMRERKTKLDIIRDVSTAFYERICSPLITSYNRKESYTFSNFIPRDEVASSPTMNLSKINLNEKI
jgi:hypothetical protein